MKVKLNGHKLDDIRRTEEIRKTSQEKIKITNKHKSKRIKHLLVNTKKNNRLRHKLKKRKLFK